MTIPPLRKITQCAPLGQLLSYMMILCLFAAGCSTASATGKNTVHSGDAVALDYTCRIEDGSILATTSKDDAYAKDAKLSNAIIVPKAFVPVDLVVGRELKHDSKPQVHPLSEEIIFRLADRLTGLTYDETQPVAIASEGIADLPESERYLHFARVMKRPKQRSISKEQFISNVGKEPVVGELLFADQPMPWKVVDVQADSVEIQYLLKDGQKLILPYGDTVVRDRDDHYELEIETRPGGLVRVGPYIGRIVDITDKLFFVDFENPFGGRELACDVTVHPQKESIDKAMDSMKVTGQAGAGQPADTQKPE